jgi:GcrA cell cycle regulator
MSAAFWTPQRVERLTRLWSEGASASEIARVLGEGATRNAVIGKIHRLGLAGRPEPSRPGRRASVVEPPPQPRRRRRLPRPLPPSVAPNEPPPEQGCATILSVGRHACRWPIGDPLAEGFTLCGRPAVRGAYCAPHAAIAYQPDPPPRDHLLRLAGLLA